MSYLGVGVPQINHQAQKQKSDATLILLDSNNNPKINITFVDSFPISLQGLDFEISTGSTEYMQGVAMFKYSYYELEVI